MENYTNKFESQNAFLENGFSESDLPELDKELDEFLLMLNRKDAEAKAKTKAQAEEEAEEEATTKTKIKRPM